MRADAQRNAEKLRAAATELYQERGLQVSLREIARRAGVSHGTLYNLFGTREALIDEVVVGLAAGHLGEAAEHSLAFKKAGEGFAYYIEKVCELQATDPAVADIVSGRYPAAVCLMALCGQTKDAATRIIERAQAAGAIRSDFTAEDLLLFFGTNALLARAAADIAPDVWRRQVAFLLDGLNTEPVQTRLSSVPLAPPQVYDVIGRLAGTP